MSFRTPRTVLTESAGSYVNGLWVAGSRTVGTTAASIQPVVMGQDMEALPEGRRISDFVKIYTSDRLKVTEDGDNIQPDYVVYDGFCYELVSIFKNQNGVIPHYKYIASKQMKFTNDAGWTSGALVRG